MNAVFIRDPRDSASPRGMADLLARLHRGEILNRQHSAFLWDAMARTRTGEARVKAGLPKGTPFAHKTGGLSGIAADVGVVTLPDGSHLALAIYVAGDPSRASAERRIAEAARAVYEHFAG
jgi:beta-lactamase class A